LGIQTFVAAIHTLKYLYTSLDLYEEQKIMILITCAIHQEEKIRQATIKTLQQIIQQKTKSTKYDFHGSHGIYDTFIRF
jgi:hypothetical protein